jgi:hypothetical protein
MENVTWVELNEWVDPSQKILFFAAPLIVLQNVENLDIYESNVTVLQKLLQNIETGFENEYERYVLDIRYHEIDVDDTIFILLLRSITEKHELKQCTLKLDCTQSLDFYTEFQDAMIMNCLLNNEECNTQHKYVNVLLQLQRIQNSVESFKFTKWGGTYSIGTIRIQPITLTCNLNPIGWGNSRSPRGINRQWRKKDNPPKIIEKNVTLSDECWDLHHFSIDKNDRGLCRLTGTRLPCTYEIGDILVGLKCEYDFVQRSILPFNVNCVNDIICLSVTNFTLDEVYRLLLLPSLVTVIIMKPHDFENYMKGRCLKDWKFFISRRELREWPWGPGGEWYISEIEEGCKQKINSVLEHVHGVPIQFHDLHDVLDLLVMHTDNSDNSDFDDSMVYCNQRIYRSLITGK